MGNPACHQRHYGMRGFSLIELAVLMTVLAAALVVSLSWIAPSSNEHARRTTITRERMDAIKNALHAFRSQYGRLPCPANPAYPLEPKADDAALVAASANSGVEDCWARTANFNNSMRGSIPTRTLGISPEYAMDGWNRLFSYQVARPICNYDPTAAIPNQVGQPLNCNAGDYEDGSGAVGVGSGWLQVDTTNPAVNCADGVSCAVNVTVDAAYVVVSHGPNGGGAWLPSGQQKALGSISAREQRNVQNGNGDVAYWDDHLSNSFDDFVLYETRPQIDQITTDFDRLPLTQEECQDFASLTLRQFTQTEATDFNAIPGLVSMFGSQLPDEAILGLLWETQEVCAKIYNNVYNGSSFTTLSHGITVVNANRFTTPGDKTDLYVNGLALRFIDPISGAFISRTVTGASSFATGVTTVNLAAGPALTAAYSQVAMQGEPIACPGSINLTTGRQFNRAMWDTNDFDGGIVVNGVYTNAPVSGFYPNSGNSGSAYAGLVNPNPIEYRNPANVSADTSSTPSSPATNSHLAKLRANDLFNNRIGFCACPPARPNWNAATGACIP
jgi:type II secretory pathway pseudopilin PulG